MVRHDDERIEEERIVILNAIETIDRLPCKGGGLEERHARFRVGGHEHKPLILDRVAPGHRGTTVRTYQEIPQGFFLDQTRMIDFLLFESHELRSMHAWNSLGTRGLFRIQQTPPTIV